MLEGLKNYYNSIYNSVMGSKYDPEKGINPITKEEISIYGQPQKWAPLMDYNQLGPDCGIAACENVLTQFGKNIPEDDLWDYAKKNNLITDGKGATKSLQQSTILRNMGVKSTTADDTLTDDGKLEELARIIRKDNRAEILTVDPDKLWNRSKNVPGNSHVVAVTGVAYDKNDKLNGFYIADSGRRKQEDQCRFIPAEEMDDAYLGFAVYTDDSKKVIA